MDNPQAITNPPAAPDTSSAPGWAGMLPPGTSLGGRYTLIEPLGAGGMGIVYHGRDEKLERAVAIKMLAPGLLNGDEARRHFRREALALARLNHPNIAAVYDVGEQPASGSGPGGNTPLDYIVMELVPGASLATRLQSGPLDIRTATAVTLEIAQALEEAHEQGVIHRDLKPANVILTSRGHAKVLDFGLARLLAPTDVTQTLIAGGDLAGTPLYMAPEQALGQDVDARTDLWSLGALYYEALAGHAPFQAGTALALLRAITDQPLTPLRKVRPDAPPEAEQITTRALEKAPGRRYQSASAMAADASALLLKLSGASLTDVRPRKALQRWALVTPVSLFALACVLGGWLYHRATQRRWAREEAIPQAQQLLDQDLPKAALDVVHKAQNYLPGDPALARFNVDHTVQIAVNSEPAGATVEVRDYLTPSAVPLVLGVTPLKNVTVPNGYLRWRISKPGMVTMDVAPKTDDTMDFSLTQAQKAPPGMVYDEAGLTGTYEAFIGWIGPYNLPPFYVDRYEVTNRDYQKFVDAGGYANEKYWPTTYQQDGKTMPWAQGMLQFRDAAGRPGPSTWSAGHFPDGQADLPVSGLSWYEASAYAAWAGKTLPTLAQWYQVAPPDLDQFTVKLSNFSSAAPAPGGTYQGLGPYGTYDTGGNVREWTANVVDDGQRFILGGTWKSQPYLYSSPEALSPFDRAEGNGFRCVLNTAPLPAAATAPVRRIARDFAKFKPVSDEVFRAYSLLYAYGKSPLNAQSQGIVKETSDWREEKVTFDTGYDGERMAAYLFLPRRVKPPYQTVLFFPSARVMFLPPDSSNLGDVNFFDYVVQSGRAVVYPVYEDTYERSINNHLPAANSDSARVRYWYQDAGRTLDYLATRPDIDSSRLGYMGVSMGAAFGVTISTLLQDRLKTAIFLDGGYFLQTPPPGTDQADFAPRMKKPVLMVNGRYDYTFPVDLSQDPMFQMLGTPAADKSHVLLDSPHDVTERRPQLIKAVLDWLDKYLGPVGQ